MICWKDITCCFCGQPFKNRYDIFREAGAGGWYVHNECHNKLSELRERWRISSRANTWTQFHMLRFNLTGKRGGMMTVFP